MGVHFQTHHSVNRSQRARYLLGSLRILGELEGCEHLEEHPCGYCAIN